MKQKIQKLIDTIIGVPLCLGLGLSSQIINSLKKNKKINPKKILVVKLWAVGESVLTLPLIRGLKDKFPDAEINVLARNANKTIYESSNLVDDVILFEADQLFKLFFKFNEYDLVFDCEPYLKISGLLTWWLGQYRIGFSHTSRAKLYSKTIVFNDSQHEVLTFMDLGKSVGVTHKAEKLEKLNWGNYAENKINEILEQEEIANSKLIGICASTALSSPYRAWPSEKFVELANKLIYECKVKIVFVGTPSDDLLYSKIMKGIKAPQNIINLVGKTNLKELFYLATKCKVFISNDTGPMHVSAAQGVKTIGLFGPNLPLRFAPFGPGNKSEYYQLPCSPCVNVHKGSFPPCKQKPQGKCMHMLSVKKVLESVKEELKCKNA